MPGDPLPCLLSIPHGGRLIPDEVADRFALDEHGWWVEDADAWTKEIYDLKESVAARVVCDVVRAVCDMNRAEDDRPPDNPDGVVKTRSCYGRRVWTDDADPTADMTERLLETWHRPYHLAVRTALQQTPGLQFAFDCHSMAAVAPEISPDPGQTRPLVCLGNLNGQSCDDADLRLLGRCLATAWQLDADDVAYNQPFAGGYITRHYALGDDVRPRVPWIQVEISRALYLADPWFHEANLEMDPTRLDLLRAGWRDALTAFFAER